MSHPHCIRKINGDMVSIFGVYRLSELVCKKYFTTKIWLFVINAIVREIFVNSYQVSDYVKTHRTNECTTLLNTY